MHTTYLQCGYILLQPLITLQDFMSTAYYGGILYYTVWINNIDQFWLPPNCPIYL